MSGSSEEGARGEKELSNTRASVFGNIPGSLFRTSRNAAFMSLSRDLYRNLRETIAFYVAIGDGARVHVRARERIF